MTFQPERSNYLSFGQGNANHDIAVGKPAIQSSASRWSSRRAAEADASIATDPQAPPSTGSHTDIESQPWWQVDLLSEYAVTKIVLTKAVSTARPMGHFHIMLSSSGLDESWVIVYTSSNDALVNYIRYGTITIEVPAFSLARFVRIQLTNFGCLYLHKCQIYGHTLSNTERQLLKQQLTSQRPQKAQMLRSRAAEIFCNRRGHISPIDMNYIFVDDDIYPACIVELLDNGFYEWRERHAVREILKGGHHVLEIGTAIGVVSMLVASLVGSHNLHTYEANPSLIDDANCNFKLNEYEGIEVKWGIVHNKKQFRGASATAPFYIFENFLASRCNVSTSSSEVCERIVVPTMCLEDAIRSHNANVLLCDIEGGEVELLVDSDLTGIETIISEVHYDIVGRASIDTMIKYLVSQGFSINCQLSGQNILVADRCRF